MDCVESSSFVDQIQCGYGQSSHDHEDLGGGEVKDSEEEDTYVNMSHDRRKYGISHLYLE